MRDTELALTALRDADLQARVREHDDGEGPYAVVEIDQWSPEGARRVLDTIAASFPKNKVLVTLTIEAWQKD
jgi:hypothetical protein